MGFIIKGLLALFGLVIMVMGSILLVGIGIAFIANLLI